MIVLLEEIRESGLAIERPLEAGWLSGILAEAKSAFAPAGPAKLKARFDRIGDKLLLTGDAKLEVAGECRRCLGAVKLEVPVHFELNLVARPEPADGDEPGGRKRRSEKAASFELESADEQPFDGREIDLGAITREEILLALPMDALCRDDCKGLCSACGQDLNVKECGCARKPTDPRWAALKDLKLG